MKLGELLKQLRNQNDLSLKKLEELSGVSQGYISDIENAKKGIVPKKDKLDLILKVLNPNEEMKRKIIEAYTDELLTPEMKKIIKSNIKLNSIKQVKTIEVPLFKSVSAGFGCEAIDDIYDFITIAEIKGNIIAIEVQGDSMEDTIMDGAVVIVNKDIMPEIGDIGVFLTTGTEYPDGLVKRLRCKNGTYVLESDNPKYDDIIIDSKNIVACGKVVKIENEPKKRKKDPILVGFNKLSEADQAVVRSMIEALSQKNK